MNSTAITRTSLILAALALAFLMPATCHAQAEINPDSYQIDNATNATNATTSQMALASQPASVTLSQPQVSAASMATAKSSTRFDRSAGLNAIRCMGSTTVTYLRRLSNFLVPYDQNSAVVAQMS